MACLVATLAVFALASPAASFSSRRACDLPATYRPPGAVPSELARSGRRPVERRSGNLADENDLCRGIVSKAGPASCTSGNDGAHLPERAGIRLAAKQIMELRRRNDLRTAALDVRIEVSNDPSELVPDHLLPVEFMVFGARPRPAPPRQLRLRR